MPIVIDCSLLVQMTGTLVLFEQERLRILEALTEGVGSRPSLAEGSFGYDALRRGDRVVADSVAGPSQPFILIAVALGSLGSKPDPRQSAAL